ncbi:uncharacterized protein T551_02775, partial [Pneumocystis jirovecii RU7]
HSLARAVARAVKRQVQAVQKASVYDDEDYLLALIVGKSYDDTQKCKDTLEKYCNGLKEVDAKLEKVDKKLKDICNNKDKKCKDLKTKITGKCTTLKTALDTIVAKPSPAGDECRKNEQECLFLEGACSNVLTENCNTLRNKCYQKKREEVAEKALLRALSGSLEDQNKCKEELKKVCLELIEESDELTKLCFYQEETCTNLLQLKDTNCQSLKTEIEGLKDDDESKKKCHFLLEKCHYYNLSCKGKYSPGCKKLVKKCKNIIYTASNLDFDPTKPETTLAEKVNLKNLYEKAEEEGIHIRRPPRKDVTTLLALLIQHQSVSSRSDNKEKCKEVLKEKCKDLKEHKILKGLCGDNNDANANGTKKCNELGQELTEHARIVSEKIIKRLFITQQNKIVTWHELKTFLTERDCTRLLSDCFYFKGQGPLDKECDNLKAACYKKGLESQANQALQDKMKGKFHDTNDTLLNIQKELVKVCLGLKEKSDHLFVLCTQPKDGAVTLLNDLDMKTNLLQEDLNEKRDFPTKKDCKELRKKCDDLKQDFEELEWPCHTLEHHCNRLNIAEELEERFLEGKVKDLDKFDSCLKNLGEQCHEWNRKGRTQFALACVAQNITCKILTKSVKSKCIILKARMKKSNVVEAAKGEKTMEETCDSWEPYCRKFMSSCQNLTTAGGGECEKLSEECKSFTEKKELELKVVDQLKGHLVTKEKCKDELDKYCTQWANASNGLETLCKENGKGDNQVREELCKKLVEQVKKQCSGLQKKLAEASKELEKKTSEYEDIKKKAEDAMKKASLVLSKEKVENNKSENEVVPSAPAVPSGKDTKPFRLIRRDATVKVTEDEAKAFDLVAQA